MDFHNSDNITLLQLDALILGDKRRDRATDGISDGSQQLGFVVVDFLIGHDGKPASVE